MTDANPSFATTPEPPVRWWHPLRNLGVLLALFGLPVLAGGLAGCKGVSANPMALRFLGTNDIQRTHAKPIGHGYYKDFDPKAAHVELHPSVAVNRVRTQHVLVASVCDEQGNGLRNRRVEWHTSGVGHIVEVDESGVFPGRGYLVDDEYAVSYTSYKERRLTLGNDDPNDDVVIRPGQTFCVITSPEEGDTHVTAYAPGIYDWEKHKVFAIKNWIDAQAVYPPCATNRVGQPHPLPVQVVRTSDGTAVPGYRVRYQILDGPAATLEPGGTQTADVLTGSDGQAQVTLRQSGAAVGVNRIVMEVRRPGATDRREIIVSRQVITKTWVAPDLSVAKTGPAIAAVGAPIPYQIAVTNAGTVASANVTLYDTLAAGTRMAGSNPPAAQEGRNLVWNLGPLQPGQTGVVQVNIVAEAVGILVNVAEAQSAEGQTKRAQATTEIVAAELAVEKRGPSEAVVGQPVAFQIVVTNNGRVAATGVRVVDMFDTSFAHESGESSLGFTIGTLQPGETRPLDIVLTPAAPGRLCNDVQVTADGDLAASDQACVNVTQPTLTIAKSGPPQALVGGEVDFAITVQNTGDTPARNVSITDTLPQQLRPTAVSTGGAISGQTVSWPVPVLDVGQQAVVTVRCQAVAVADQVTNVAVVQALGVPPQQDSATLSITGVPALLTEIVDTLDPLPLGGEMPYAFQVTNQGSVPATNVTVELVLPRRLEFVDAEGATAFRYDEATRTVRFEPYPALPAGAQLRGQVQVRATAKGDARTQLRVQDDRLASPVVKEESTTIYDRDTGAISLKRQPPTPDDDGLMPAGSVGEDVPADRPRSRPQPAPQPQPRAGEPKRSPRVAVLLPR